MLPKVKLISLNWIETLKFESLSEFKSSTSMNDWLSDRLIFNGSGIIGQMTSANSISYSFKWMGFWNINSLTFISTLSSFLLRIHQAPQQPKAPYKGAGIPTRPASRFGWLFECCPATLFLASFQNCSSPKSLENRKPFHNAR